MSIEKYDEDKQNFLQELEKLKPELMAPDAWDQAQKKRVAELLSPTQTRIGMLTSIPMRCAGPDCPFAESCFLLKEDLAPIGESCPIEFSAAQQFFANYVEDLDVDVTRLVEVSLVRDLVDQEIQQMRKTWLLSQEHFIQENVVGLDEEGNVVTKKELHQAIDYEDRILKRKEKLRNALLATRESQARAHKGLGNNPSQAISNLMDDMRRQLNQTNESDTYDAYIDAEVVEEEEIQSDSDMEF